MGTNRYKFLSVITMIIAISSLIVAVLTCLRVKNYRRMCCSEYNKIQDPFNDREIDISEDIDGIDENEENIHVHHDSKIEITEE